MKNTKNVDARRNYELLNGTKFKGVEKSASSYLSGPEMIELTAKHLTGKKVES